MPPDRITNYDAMDAIFLQQAFNSCACKGRVVCGRSRLPSHTGLRGGICNLCRQGKDDLNAANQEEVRSGCSTLARLTTSSALTLDDNMFHVLGLSADVADAWRARTENFVR